MILKKFLTLLINLIKAIKIPKYLLRKKQDKINIISKIKLLIKLKRSREKLVVLKIQSLSYHN
jgi:hypothetical protein